MHIFLFDSLICLCKIQIPTSKSNSVFLYFILSFTLVFKRHGSQFNQNGVKTDKNAGGEEVLYI